MLSGTEDERRRLLPPSPKAAIAGESPVEPSVAEEEEYTVATVACGAIGHGGRAEAVATGGLHCRKQPSLKAPSLETHHRGKLISLSLKST
ncbi:hypothetical protein L2E82_38715 [Cichorium intybus]|uniref:Uncharacterized protein n=1 Tax=Cichorium intybus TaxID=13427 RepID=A0ACB9AGP4_CICIN|nr:hypothetical protein L2E82_38715 [Cichorium intybus]